MQEPLDLKTHLQNTCPNVSIEDCKAVIEAYNAFQNIIRKKHCTICYKKLTEAEKVKRTLYDTQNCCDEHREFASAWQEDIVRKQLGIETKELYNL